MKKNPSVLVGVATSEHKDYCVKEFIEQLKGFNYDNYSIFVVDNSYDKQHTKIFEKEGIEVDHVTRYKQNGNEKRHNVLLTESQNRIRTKFLEGEYDYLLMLESDCFVNKNIISWGVSHEAPVYSLTYPIKVGRYKTPSQCLQYLHILRGKGQKKVMSNTLMLPPKITIPYSCKQITDHRLSNNMTLTHNGLGCCLIHRDVMQLVEFRIDRANDIATGKMTFSDTFFYTDLIIKKIKCLLDTRLTVNHVKAWM